MEIMKFGSESFVMEILQKLIESNVHPKEGENSATQKLQPVKIILINKKIKN